MQINTLVGPVATTSSLAPNSSPIVRAGNMGDLIVSELHGRYYEGAYRRTRFNAANQAGVTTTVGVAATYVGICLSNPVGSLVNLVVEKVGYSIILVPTGVTAVGIMCGYNSGTNVTHTTPLTVRSNFVGVGAAGTGLVDSSATLPTAPAVTHILATMGTAATTAWPPIPIALTDLEGSIVLPPGAYAAVFTSLASGASGFMGSISWAEVPV